MRSSQRGSHQLRSPSSSIVAGTSSMRTIVASSSTATAQAEAEQLDDPVGLAEEAAEDDDHDRRGGGDDPGGRGQAVGDRVRLSPVRSYSSRTRESRKTS